MSENKLKKLYELSIENRIPLLDKNTAVFICNIINKKNIQHILEIGSGAGYSSGFFSLHCPVIKSIESIEKDYSRFLLASENKVSNKIKFINSSYPEFIPAKKYDLIFLDGPKSSIYEQVKFYQNFLNEKGIIIIDNINLNRLNLEKKNSRKLYDKMLLNKKLLLENYPRSEFIDIEDGIIIIYF